MTKFLAQELTWYSDSQELWTLRKVSPTPKCDSFYSNNLVLILIFISIWTWTDNIAGPKTPTHNHPATHLKPKRSQTTKPKI